MSDATSGVERDS